MAKIYKYRNTILDVFQRNTRKLNAIIRQNQIKRIKVYVMLIAMCISFFKPLFAIENPNIEYGEYGIYCYKDPNMYITYDKRPQPNYEYYYIKNNEEYSVYCLNLRMKGAEDYNGYLVNGSQKIDDPILQSIVLNCYPYKSIQELGVSTKSQAKFASQFAIWTYKENLNLGLIESIGDNQNVVDAIKKIYNEGISNVGKYSINLDREVSNQNYEEINNIQYYKKDIRLKNLQNIKDVNITCNDSNIKIVKSNDIFTIYVPVSIVKNVYNVELNFDIVAKENVALLGFFTLEGFQDVALTLKDTFVTYLKDNIEFKNDEVNITVIKKDKDTDIPIQGVVYSLTTKDGNEIGRYVTDKEGKIKIKVYDYNIKELYLKEIETLKEYKIDENIHRICIDGNKDIELNLYNEKKKGSISIIKKTKEYNEITNIRENMPLSNVSFYIYDKDMNIVDDITTDKNGYANSIKLPLGKYYLKEYKTNNGYKLLDDMIEVELINEDECISIEILNENVSINNKLPKTGM